MFDIGSFPPKRSKSGSNLVRRLLEARDDPAKQRIREWFGLIDDERLLSFGFTRLEIADLRSAKSPPR
jgi:hypothetical protein